MAQVLDYRASFRLSGKTRLAFFLRGFRLRQSIKRPRHGGLGDMQYTYYAFYSLNSYMASVILILRCSLFVQRNAAIHTLIRNVISNQNRIELHRRWFRCDTQLYCTDTPLVQCEVNSAKTVKHTSVHRWTALALMMQRPRPNLNPTATLTASSSNFNRHKAMSSANSQSPLCWQDEYENDTQCYTETRMVCHLRFVLEHKEAIPEWLFCR